MSITHTNRKGHVYYLVTRPKRGGGLQYIFSKKNDTSPVEKMPDGHVIHETPDGMVYLRRKEDQVVTDAEIQLVRESLPASTGKHSWVVDFKKDIITIHETEHYFDLLGEMPGIFRPSPEKLAKIQSAGANYMAVMRFCLIDTNTRLFLSERYCFRGSVENWISLGPPAKLAELLGKFTKQLGRESMFEL